MKPLVSFYTIYTIFESFQGVKRQVVWNWSVFWKSATPLVSTDIQHLHSLIQQVLLRFKSYILGVRGLQWWESSTMVPARYKVIFQLSTQPANTCSKFRTRCEKSSKLTINTPEQCHWHHFVSLFLILNIFHTFF